MPKVFSDMKTNVGSNVNDSNSTLATKIGVWLNDAYEDIWRRCMWTAIIDDDYTFESIVGTTSYALPLDFEEELFVADIANGHEVDRYQIGSWWRDRATGYQADSISNGNPARYRILREVITTGSPAGAIALDPPPDTAETYAMPYKRRFVKLLGTTDTCTTDTANKIIASSATFITDGVQPGMRVKNTTDATYGMVATVDSETQLTMDTDLCPDGNEGITVSNEVLIPNIHSAMEAYASSMAFAYKNQMARADWYMQRYEYELRKRVAEERSKINQLYQMISQEFRVKGPRRLTGDLSYDSL